MDSKKENQKVEILGRNWLINELVNANLEVGLPIRDRGIDLIAFADLDIKVKCFIACPVQIKVASIRSFAINNKYAKLPTLILAYIWHLNDSSKTVVYALTYEEAVLVADKMKWTKTLSWEKRGYSNQKLGNKLLNLIEEHKMSSQKWWDKIIGVSERTDYPIRTISHF